MISASARRSLLALSRSSPRSSLLIIPSTLHHSVAVAVAARSFAASALGHKESSDQRYTKPAWDVGASTNKVVLFDELKQITQNPNDNILLIDVREPDEVALGSIPSSVNLPLSNFEKSLSMDEGDFTRVHGFHKPEKGQQIIFYCRSGKRSTTAMELAKKKGYRALRNYEGSYIDWSSKASQDD